MQKFIKHATSVVSCIYTYRRAIGIILTALVTLIGVDTATEETIIPPELVPSSVQKIIDSGA